MTKNEKTLLAVFGAIALLVLALMFVIPSHYKLFVQRAGAFPNLIGALLVIGSWVYYYVCIKRQSDSTTAGIIWAALLVGGLVTAAGFNFDYFGL